MYLNSVVNKANTSSIAFLLVSISVCLVLYSDINFSVNVHNSFILSISKTTSLSFISVIFLFRSDKKANFCSDEFISDIVSSNSFISDNIIFNSDLIDS